MLERTVLESSVLADEAPEGYGPTASTTTRVREWLLLLSAGVNRERLAMIVAVTAVSVAALVIVVIPVMTGRIG